MVLRLRQHNIGYTADGFYRSDDPTNSVKALKEGGLIQRTNQITRVQESSQSSSNCDPNNLALSLQLDVFH